MKKAQKDLVLHEVLADKWTALVLDTLGGGDMRFSRLQKSLNGVTQKALTKTLRRLERDGLVRRRVHPVVPPRVDYKLTKLGESLSESLSALRRWLAANATAVERARAAYDRKS